MPKKYTFTKDERLKSRKIIGSLFAGGQSYGAYPVRAVWRDLSEKQGSSPVKIAFSVPKKRFKTAVARNLLKRRMREAWRLQKHRLYGKKTQDSEQTALMLIYTGKEELPYTEIEKAVAKVIWRLGKQDWK